jgi:hypothetical protein
MTTGEKGILKSDTSRNYKQRQNLMCVIKFKMFCSKNRPQS